MRCGDVAPVVVRAACPKGAPPSGSGGVPGGGDPSVLDANYPPTNCWPEAPWGGGGGAWEGGSRRGEWGGGGLWEDLI